MTLSEQRQERAARAYGGKPLHQREHEWRLAHYQQPGPRYMPGRSKATSKILRRQRRLRRG